MSDKKEVWFIGIGLAAGGFITIFSDFFQSVLTPFFPDPRSIVFVKTLSGVFAIVCGLAILRWYSKYPPKNINDNKSEDSAKADDKKLQPNDQSLEFKKTDDKKGSKKLLLADYFIILIMALCLGSAIYLYLAHQPLIPYSETSTDFLKDYPNETFAHTSFNFTSEVFSAQSEIHVDIITDIDPTFADKHQDIVAGIQNVQILLPDATPKNPTYERGHLLSVPIVLTLDPINKYYKGNGIIIYQAEGEKCYILTTNKPPKTSPNCLPNATPIIHISSADSLFQLGSNRLNTSLTLVVIAFTVVSIRAFAKSMTDNKSYWKKDNGKSDRQFQHRSKNKHS